MIKFVSKLAISAFYVSSSFHKSLDHHCRFLVEEVGRVEG